MSTIEQSARGFITESSKQYAPDVIAESLVQLGKAESLEQAQQMIADVQAEQSAAPVIEAETNSVRAGERLASVASSEQRACKGVCDGALHVASLGVPQIPLRARTKIAFSNDWPTLATTDPEQIRNWAEQYPDCNFASVALAQPGGIWVFEIDNKDAVKSLNAPKLPKTFMVRSRPGRGHYYFRHNAASLALAGLKDFISIKVDGKEAASARLNHAYCVTAGSIHPDTGLPYEIVDGCDVDLIEAPQDLIDWIKAQHTENKTQRVWENNKPIPEGQRDNELTSLAGKARRTMRMDEEQLYAYLSDVNDKRCQPPKSDDDIRRIAHSIGKKPIRDDRVLHNGVFTETVPQNGVQQPVEPPEPVTEYAMTAAEIEAEHEKPYPVFRLVEQGGPTWEDDIMYGIAGKIVKKASEYNEAHPAGMYLDFLISMGSIFGRHAYFNVNSTAHYATEFMARIGLSSESRKGSGRDAIDEILKLVDSKWYAERVKGGFGSAQAIISELKDAVEQQVFSKKTAVFKTVHVPGIEDKRLCVREGELASVFQLAGMADSRADIVLRDGWDGKPLYNIVKGKTDNGFSNSAQCQQPHLSISGDTTKAELFRKMPSGADENGFGNRFLYCYVYRTKLCPLGGPQIDWAEEVVYLFDVIKFAQQQKYIPLSKAAEKVWNRMYLDLDLNRPKGLAGKMTARGPAHVRRLALILALLDMSAVVESRHLQAARRLWDYCQESAEYIFSGVTRDQHKIMNFAEARQSVTAVQVREELFQRHQKASWVQAQLNELVRRGNLAQSGERFLLKQRAA